MDRNDERMVDILTCWLEKRQIIKETNYVTNTRNNSRIRVLTGVIQERL